MTELSPIGAETVKGKVMEEVAKMVEDAHESGGVETLIARSADFYGPGVANSLMEAAISARINNGKKPQWLGKKDANQNFTCTPDAVKATVPLGTTNDASGKV